MLLKDPRIQLTITLFLIFLSAVFYYKDIPLFKNLFVAVGSAVFFDLLFLKLRKIEFFVPTAAIASGLIISLLISPSVSFYEIVIASALAMLSKNFIKGPNRHIFNPAALGILLSSLIFGRSVSWWAVSFQPLNSIYFLILLSPLLVSMIRLKRFMITIPFLLIYSSLIVISNKVQFLNVFADPTVLFFSIVMLPEPMTTPNEHKIQIFFGIFVAVFAILSSKLLNSIDPLILALLAGNLIFYRLK